MLWIKPTKSEWKKIYLFLPGRKICAIFNVNLVNHPSNSVLTFVDVVELRVIVVADWNLWTTTFAIFRRQFAVGKWQSANNFSLNEKVISVELQRVS